MYAQTDSFFCLVILIRPVPHIFSQVYAYFNVQLVYIRRTKKVVFPSKGNRFEINRNAAVLDFFRFHNSTLTLRWLPDFKGFEIVFAH